MSMRAGKWLVPVGDLVSTHIYMAEDGMLYEHAWEIDELYASAERGGVLVERLAAAAHHRKISLYEASIHADVGSAIAVAESTPRIEPASDRVSSYWQDPKLSVRADHGEPPSIPKTLLGACSEALFMRVMRRARALAPQAEIHAEGNSLDALESAGFQVSWS